MADGSSIEWTDATWNPVTGCSKVSQGCKNCYALRDWARLSAPRPKPNIYTGRAFTDVREHMDRLEQPLRWTKPRRIFVNSMSDLFHEDVSPRFIADVFGVMAAAPQHTFQVLTKRASRMRQLLNGTAFVDQVKECAALYSPSEPAWPLPNVWLCVSAEDQATAVERVPLLLATPAAVRGVSAEPLLGAIALRTLLLPAGSTAPGFTAVNAPQCVDALAGHLVTDLGIAYDLPARLDWVIVGGESGPRARPMHPDWARSLRDQCEATDTPFFFKQWGEWREFDDSGLPGVRICREGDPEFTAQAAKCDAFIAFDGELVRSLEFARMDVGYRGLERIGKAAAGRQLDGRTHDEFPGVR